MSTATVWLITLAGVALLMAAATQTRQRPRIATVLIAVGIVPVVVGSFILWSRTGVFG